MKCSLCEFIATHRKIEPSGEVLFYCAQHAPTSATLIGSPTGKPTKVYIALLIIGVVIIIGALTIGISGTNTKNDTEIITNEINTIIGLETETEVPVVPLGTPGTANTFFSFLDTFTTKRDMGTPQVVLMVPELDVIAFEYGTSQESTHFGVYNYVTNTLYKGIGGNNYVEAQRAVAVLPNNQLLIWVSPGVDAAAGTRPRLIIVDYTTNQLIATIAIPAKAPSYFHQAFNFNGSRKTGSLILKNSFDHTEKTIYETWELNLETLILKKGEPLG